MSEPTEPKIERTEDGELRSRIERLRNSLQRWEESPNFPSNVSESYKEKVRELVEELEAKLAK